MIKETQGYKDIVEFYGDRTAKRSGVPLINHIKEGLIILDFLQADLETKEAFCIHPLCQDELELTKFKPERYSSSVVFLAMEYRNHANRFLSNCNLNEIRISLVMNVNLMLTADKVQNRKDFMSHHYGKHENSDKLKEYFDRWLTVVKIDNPRYDYLCSLIDKEKIDG